VNSHCKYHFNSNSFDKNLPKVSGKMRLNTETELEAHLKLSSFSFFSFIIDTKQNQKGLLVSSLSYKEYGSCHSLLTISKKFDNLKN
jgi:hypothetical protein